MLYIRIFIRRDSWAEKAISRAGSYTWGGRLEQKRVAEMRERFAKHTPSTRSPIKESQVV